VPRRRAVRFTEQFDESNADLSNFPRFDSLIRKLVPEEKLTGIEPATK
jgi:hypothetical protein